MAQLDQFLRVMVERAGAEMRLAAGHEPQLRHDGTSTSLISRTLTAAQIRFLMREITPPAEFKELETRGVGEFGYTPEGLPSVVVSARAWSGETEVIFRVGSPRARAKSPEMEMPARPAPAATPRRAEPPPDEPVSGGIGGREPDIQDMFRLMVKMGASDLHLSTGQKPMVRKDGDMTRLEHYDALTPASLASVLYPVMTERARGQYEREKDADFAYEVKGLSRFRGNVFSDRHGMGAVFRTIPTEIVTAETLGLSQNIQNLCYLSKGLVLVTGPTGSGKSTTLAALVDLINRTRSDHIITIEDPIEFVHPSKKCLVNQREVGEHTESFKRALRAALREDPDIVLVGEMRDLETVAIAIETAETGHLVFGTLHTSTAYSTIDRIIDQFPADRQEQIRVMLSESLKAVVAQTLCKKIGGGRVAALEVLLVNAAVSNLIREGKTFQIPSIMQTQRKAGMVLMNDALMELVDAKKVDVKEAYIKAIDKTNFINAARAAGHKLEFLSATEK